MLKIKNILILSALVISTSILSTSVLAIESMDSPAPLPTVDDPESIVILTPQPDSTVMNRNTEFKGTAYKNALVNITIDDIDTNSIFIEHQSNGRLTGTTTSDDNGNWSFVPQQQLIPGKYSVSATVADIPQPSRTINFYVNDESGASSWIARWLIYTIIAVLGLIFLVCLFMAVRHWLRARRNNDEPTYEMTENQYPEETLYSLPTRRQYVDPSMVQDGMSVEELSELDHEAAEVQKDLASASRQIDNAVREVADFRDKIHEAEGDLEIMTPVPTVVRKVTRRNPRHR